MKRTLLAIVGTVTGLVALLSFKTHPAGSAALPSPLATGFPRPSTSAAAPDPASSGAPASPSTSPPSAGSSPAATSGTFTGAAADTRYGPVQVQITVTDGRVTAAAAVAYPQESPRDDEINAQAVPILDQEATDAGTANIDVVSGATYTSDGYIESLQSALDQAGI